jgi:putative hydrolase of HD superfamily
MILQAQEYEAEGSSEKSLDQFFTSTEGKWRTEIGRAWAEEIVSRRKKSDT